MGEKGEKRRLTDGDTLFYNAVSGINGEGVKGVSGKRKGNDNETRRVCTTTNHMGSVNADGVPAVCKEEYYWKVALNTNVRRFRDRPAVEQLVSSVRGGLSEKFINIAMCILSFSPGFFSFSKSNKGTDVGQAKRNPLV